MFATSFSHHAVYAIVVNGRWRPGIGDPTFWGWAITAGYAIAAVLGIWSAIVQRLPAEENNRRFWIAVSALLLALGANKQLDLQTWLWLVGRQMARNQGWYEYKDAVRLVIAGCIALSGLLFIVVSTGWKRTNLKNRLIAMLGMTFLLFFVVIRALSFHEIDAILWRRMANLSAYALLELGGVILVCVSAFVAGPLASFRGKSAEQSGTSNTADMSEQAADLPRD